MNSKAHVAQCRDGTYELWVASDYNKTLGGTAIIAGAVFIPIALLFVSAFRQIDMAVIVWWILVTLALWVGFFLWVLMKKEPIILGREAIIVTDRLGAQPRRIPIATGAYIEIANSYRKKKGFYFGKWRTETVWIIRLSGGGEGDIFESPESYLATRVLAEEMCKRTGLPFLDHSDPTTGRSLINAQDLDLAFGERAKKYPQLLESYEIEGLKIVPHGITDRCFPDGTRQFSWPFLTGGVVTSLLFGVGMVLVFFFLPGKDLAPSFFDQYGWTGARIFGTTAGSLLLLLLGLIAAVRFRLTVRSENTDLAATFLGLELLIGSLGNRAIEDVQVHGNAVVLISDAAVLTARTFRMFGGKDWINALWLAHEIRKELAAQG